MPMPNELPFGNQSTLEPTMIQHMTRDWLGMVVETKWPRLVQRNLKSILTKSFSNMCSRFLNKQTGCLLENEKNPTYSHLFGTKQLLIFSKTSHLYVFIPTYIFLLTKEIFKTFCQIKLMLAIFSMNFTRIFYQNSKLMVPHGSH